jgi:hypothetical protein
MLNVGGALAIVKLNLYIIDSVLLQNSGPLQDWKPI